MGLLNLGWAVLFLPLVFLVVSYAVETRRSVAITCTVGTALAAVAALLVLAVEVGHGRPTHESTVPIFTYSVIQTPFNAATKTLLAATFQPSIGVLVDPLSSVLALAAAGSALVLQLFLVTATRGAGGTALLHRAVALAVTATLGVVLAPGYVQAAGSLALLAIAAYLAAADDAGTVGLRVAARRLFLTAWLAAVGLLLVGVFLASKFSGAIEAAATSGKHPSATYPDGFDFVALAQRWLAVPHGTVTGVGTRTMVLAAVLELVVALLLVAAVALVAASRRAASPAGVAVAWIAVVGLGAGGVALLLRTAVLLEVATHALVAVGAAGALAAVGCAAVAVLDGPVDRRLLWLAASALATAVAGVGLGAVAGAAALVATVALAVPAALGALAAAAAQGGGRSRSLPALLREGGVAGRAVLLGLLSVAGAAGAGTFFARSAILTAAWTGRLPAGTTLDPAARAAVAALVVAAGALAAVAVARLLVPPSEPSPSGRLRRLPRSARPRPVRLAAGLLPMLLTAAGLALVSGLAVLPGIGPSMGGFVATPPGRAALPVNVAALLLTLLVPVVAGVAAFVLGRSRGPVAADAAREGGRWPAVAAAWMAALERVGLGAPGRLLLAVDARLGTVGLGAVGEGVRGLAVALERLARARRQGVAAAMVAAAVLLVAGVALWVGVQHTGQVTP